MKHYKKQYTYYETIVKITCDSCGQETKPSNKISIIRGYYMQTNIDICDDCYKNKLIPWMDTTFGSKL